ncbi:MAG: RluA family pseudouridine synthase, partial [Negativicutes bacterium]|nr:RluA family pseudouridine synthase [Negativicutes bacterium]
VMRQGIVHRLDKDTSGLIVAATNDEAHRRLAVPLQRRIMHREYLAVACGHSPNRQFTVTGPIGRDRRNRLKMSVVTDGKPASTSFTVVEQFSRHCLLKCQLASGRTHQIRVHLAHIGLPVYGDPLYGNRLVGREFGGQALHAARLSFAHPGDGRLLTFTAPLPGCFRQLLDRLRHP